uniref:Putative DNA binding, helix-turn-helix domain containing protein n=1 Tax=viral metagenome TaxID=1070528 RepID=A0A6M3J816_9ZZZZ
MEVTRKAIRIKRIERNWTQVQLAEAAGMTPGTVGRIERGEPCTLAVLERIAAAFKCTVGDLL